MDSEYPAQVTLIQRTGLKIPSYQAFQLMAGESHNHLLLAQLPFRAAPTLISTLPKSPSLPRNVKIRTLASNTEFIATTHVIRNITLLTDRRCRPSIDAVRGLAGFPWRDPA